MSDEEAQIRANLYAQVLANDAGQKMLEDLDRIYCTRLLHLGADGSRKTDIALGQFSVVEFMKAQVSLAKSGVAPLQGPDPY